GSAIRPRRRRVLANLQSEYWSDERLRYFAGFLLDQVSLAEAGLGEEIRRNLSVVAGFIFQTFRRRAISKIVVTRQARGAGKMRLARPQSGGSGLVGVNVF